MSLEKRTTMKLSLWTKWRHSDEMVKRVNRIRRGWGNYFHHGSSTPVFRSANHWLYQRVRAWLHKKQRGQGAGQSKYVRFPNEMLAKKLGVYTLPNHVKWLKNAPR
jgi:hypothetical protein